MPYKIENFLTNKNKNKFKIKKKINKVIFFG
jgi:hypothetical protein